MTTDREKLIQAALAGFATTREGFNGECWYAHLVADEAEISDTFARAQQEHGHHVRAAVELALARVGLLTDVDVEACETIIQKAIT
jgi:hypothetical protein